MGAADGDAEDILRKKKRKELKAKKSDVDKGLQQVDAEIKLGGELGVRGTPNFFINDKRLVGAQPADAFKKLIDAELSAKKK